MELAAADDSSLSPPRSTYLLQEPRKFLLSWIPESMARSRRDYESFLRAERGEMSGSGSGSGGEDGELDGFLLLASLRSFCFFQLELISFYLLPTPNTFTPTSDSHFPIITPALADYVLVQPIPERGESYAFSVPLSSVYSIIVYPPSLSKWYGSLTIK